MRMAYARAASMSRQPNTLPTQNRAATAAAGAFGYFYFYFDGGAGDLT